MSAKNRLERAFDTLSKRKDAMNEDLIERLRNPNYAKCQTFSESYMREAAAEIERLRKHKRLQTEDIMTLGELVYADEKTTWKARAEAAEKRLAEAEKVIEPFARIARIWAFDLFEGDAISVRGTHLRAAAEWMEKGDE